MQLVADLHLHSKYSRATSKELDLSGLYRWCLKKGVNLIGTADFTHPKWFAELKENLQPAADGLYHLKTTEDTRPCTVDNRKMASVQPYYVLTSEISCIYTQGGKMRRIHVVLVAPSLETVAKINQALGKRGNLFSDGRPIFGLSAYELAKVIWNIDEQVIIIPAHIWTPWFSLFGSMSGFDSIEECFNELNDRILAVETGLSSDPPMNWRLSQLDKVAIVSCGDGHSGGNLMREATIFEVPSPSFDAIVEALKNSNAITMAKNPKSLPRRPAGEIRNSNFKNSTGDSDIQTLENFPRIIKTIEFYPEEGKYHWDGHRACGVRLSPPESKKLESICPKCHRPLTIGVMNRVEQLADRAEDYITANRPPFQKLVQLSQIIAESFGKSETSVAVKAEYDRLVNLIGNEHLILSEISAEQLAKNHVDDKIIEGLERVRAGNISIEPGYDGVFGTVRVFELTRTVIKQTLRQDITDRQQTLF